jgi:hypothetical protein
MFEIPVALEAPIASKEVLVLRPAPSGIRPFLGNKRPVQGIIKLSKYKYLLAFLTFNLMPRRFH